MRISTALLVFSLVAWLPVQAASALQWHAYGGHSYALTTNFGTWQSAEAEAVALGGHLVTINDAAENNWIIATFPARSGNGSLPIAWIGYNADAGPWDGVVANP